MLIVRMAKNLEILLKQNIFLDYWETNIISREFCKEKTQLINCNNRKIYKFIMSNRINHIWTISELLLDNIWTISGQQLDHICTTREFICRTIYWNKNFDKVSYIFYKCFTLFLKKMFC